jgi:hypothetical protein
MSTWRCGWICLRSYFFAAVLLAGASFAVLLAGTFLAGVTLSVSSRPERRAFTLGRCQAVRLWGADGARLRRPPPRPAGPPIERRTRKTNRPVHVGFIDDRGREVAAYDVTAIRTSAYPTDSTDDRSVVRGGLGDVIAGSP